MEQKVKRYIWGFPGIGKSNLISVFNAVDADCEFFKFKNVQNIDLHSGQLKHSFEKDESYPQNYLNYIQDVKADIVLVNCHISLLECLDKEQVLLVYPSEELLPEYLQRYQDRGDNSSYISYMKDEMKGIIDILESSHFEKYKISNSNIYLNDLFKRSDFKMKLMTRTELTNQLKRAMDLHVIDAVIEDNRKLLVCDLSFVNENVPERRINNPSVWAEAVLDGEYALDIDQLLSVCDKRENTIRLEAKLAERRGGLSREELGDKIMQGIVNGALGIYYGQIAPYSHGYEVSYKSDTCQRSWHCYCSLFDIPKDIVKDIENASQNNSKSLNVSELLDKINKMEEQKLNSFTPEKDAGLERNNYPYRRGHVATVADVHAGRGLDGIVKHHYHGTWSTMTPVKENELVEAMVFLKGFCLDLLYEQNLRNPVNGIRGEDLKGIIEYLKKHGTDISTPEKLQEWIKNNPEKCGIEENRNTCRFNDGHILYQTAYSDFLNLQALVSQHEGTLDEFLEQHPTICGDWYDDVIFNCEYGAINASIFENGDGSLGINSNNLSIWDAKRNEIVKDDITLDFLKNTCAEIGFDVKELEASAKARIKGGLDAKIADAAARVSDNKDDKQKNENMLTK